MNNHRTTFRKNSGRTGKEKNVGLHVRQWFRRRRGTSTTKMIRCLLKTLIAPFPDKSGRRMTFNTTPHEIGNHSAWQVALCRHFRQIWHNIYSMKVGLKCTSQMSKATCDRSTSRFSFGSSDRSSCMVLCSLSVRLASGMFMWVVSLPLAVILTAEVVFPACILRSKVR